MEKLSENTITIVSNQKWWKIDLKELWEYRELFYIFTWRDIKVRYKQTLLGIGWAVFQPLVTMIIFTFFFGNLAKIPSGNMPYFLFVLCGLVFWGFFSGAITHSSNSLIENENIIKKVYFPKIILPLSSVVTSFVDFVITLILLLVFVFSAKSIPHPLFLVVVPYGILVTIVASSGVGLFLGSLNVKYRDVRYILPFFIQILMFTAPVIYPTTIVTSTNKLFMALNPMTGVIESVRTTISGSGSIDFPLLGISSVSAIVLFLIGLRNFRFTEKFIADIV